MHSLLIKVIKQWSHDKKIENLKLITFSEEHLEEFQKKQEVKKEEIYKLLEFKIFPARVFVQFRKNTMAKLLSDGSINLSLFDKTKIARWKKKKIPLNQVFLILFFLMCTWRDPFFRPLKHI